MAPNRRHHFGPMEIATGGHFYYWRCCTLFWLYYFVSSSYFWPMIWAQAETS